MKRLTLPSAPLLTAFAVGAISAILAFTAPLLLSGTETPRPAPVTTPKPLPEAFRIGIVTDMHGQTGKQYSYKFMDPDKIMRPLIRFEGYMADVFNPDLVVQDGDLVEGTGRKGEKSVTDFTFLTDEFSRTGIPVLHVIGNHDRRGFDDATWKSLTGNDSTYYFRDQDDVRIVVLDYDDADRDADESDDAGDAVSVLPASSDGSGGYTMSERQFQWLERTLADAGNRRIVVFTHVPVSENGFQAGNLVNPIGQRERLRDLFAEYGVKAVVSGHVELLRYEEDRGVGYFVLPGFHRSEAKSKPVPWFGTHAAMTITDRATMLVRYEKEFGGPYEEIIVPSPEFDAMEK